MDKFIIHCTHYGDMGDVTRAEVCAADFDWHNSKGRVPEFESSSTYPVEDCRRFCEAPGRRWLKIVYH